MHRCSKCGQPWDDARAQDNELTCTRRCGGRLVPVAPPALPDLDGCDFARLPYPVALTARRLAAALQTSGDVLKTLFLLKDCFEATIKYLGAMMLADYRLGPACTPEHNASLLEKMIRPSLGVWVETVVGSLSRWLVGGPPPGGLAAGLFMTPGKKPRETELFARCREFVEYRNGALGHGAMRSDLVYDADLRAWLPRLRQLLDGVAGLAGWRLCLPTDRDRCRVWMGPQPGDATEPGDFSGVQAGRFVLRGPDGPVRDLYPFLCYLPDPQQERRLHFYDSLSRYSVARKEVEALEYDHGFKQASPEPVAGLEEAFTADLLAKAFGRHRGRMAVIEGRVANFGELIEAHAAIVGRRFAIEHVRRFLAEHDRGLLVIEAQPGKGKTALMAHLIEEVFGHYAPRPVHFFYRRTAGITDPDVCARSLYQALLDAHGITEAEESKQKNSPEEVYIKLTNLLSQEIAPRLLPGRPQLIFIDALDEAASNAFRRIPENLPAGVYVLVTTRPVSDRTTLARRQNVSWYDLDAPDLLQENLRDGREYVQRELAGMELPDEALDEVARVGAGNFLVLKLLCQHLRTALAPSQVADFLSRLATDGGEDRLGFIYAEFWQRLTERCTRQDENLLCDAAGVLVTAHAPLPADMACGVLGLRAGDWDFALRHLAEYLTAVAGGEDGGGVTYYRVYHESFADFLRQKVAPDRQRLGRLLGDYCLRWAELPEGYARAYALRFGPRHLLDEGRGEEAADLLLDLAFLEAKAEAGMVFELAGDFSAVAAALGEEDHRRRWLELIEEALRRDIHFIHRHHKDYPQGLFQCLWNTGWWYDCPEASRHYETSKDVLEMERASFFKRFAKWLTNLVQGTPSKQLLAACGDARPKKLYELLESWRTVKEQATPHVAWLRSLRPPPVGLGMPLAAILRGHEGHVWGVAFSPGGQLVVSGGMDGTVRIWDVRSGIEMRCLKGHNNKVTGVAFSPDGRWIASSSWDRTVRLWDAMTGAELVRLNGQGPSVHSVAFSPDGQQLAAGMEGLVQVWDMDGAGFSLGRFQEATASVAFSPDGKLLACGVRDGTVRVWKRTDGQELWSVRSCERGMTSVAFSPDGRRLAGSGEDCGVRVWDAISGEEILRINPSADVHAVAFSHDGQWIASGEAFGPVRVWDAQSGSEFLCLEGHRGYIQSVAFSPDDRYLISGGAEEAVWVWKLEANSNSRALLKRNPVLSMAFSSDGRQLACGCYDGTVRVWDIRTSIELHCLRGHIIGCVNGVAFSPDGGRLVSGADDTTVRVWDVASGKLLRCLSGHQNSVKCVAFSPDGLRIASGGLDRTIRVWNSDTGTEDLCLREHANLVHSVSFSPDGLTLISGGWDGLVRIWDAHRGTELHCLAGHERWVMTVAFSPDGRYIITAACAPEGVHSNGAWDGVVRVWNSETYDCLRTIRWSGDVLAVGSGPPQFPWLAAQHSLEVALVSAACGEESAWFSFGASAICTHPSGRIWAAYGHNYLCLFTLEGAG